MLRLLANAKDTIIFLQAAVALLFQKKEENQQSLIKSMLRQAQINALGKFVGYEEIRQRTDDEQLRLLFDMPPGVGKTRIYVVMIRRFLESLRQKNAPDDLPIIQLEGQSIVSDSQPIRKKIIVVVPSKVRIGETAKEFLEEGIKVGQYSSIKKDTDPDVIIVTRFSLKGLLEKIGTENVGLVVHDEAHDKLTDKLKELFEKMKLAPILGFTASPTDDTRQYYETVHSLSYDEAERLGYLPPHKNYVLTSNTLKGDLRKYSNADWTGADFEKALGKESIAEMIYDIAHFYFFHKDASGKEDIRNKKGIIRFSNVELAKKAARLFNEVAAKLGMGEIARPLYSGLEKEKDSNRKKIDPQSIIADHKAGKFKLLFVHDMCVQAHDDPEIEFVAGPPTRKPTIAEQFSGRTSRIDKNNPKKEAFIVECIPGIDGRENPLEAAKKNGQVLFWNTIGKLDPVSTVKVKKYANSGLELVRPDTILETNQAKDDFVLDIGGVYKVKYKATLMQDIVRQYQEKAKENYIIPKGDQYLSAGDISRMLKREGIFVSRAMIEMKFFRFSNSYYEGNALDENGNPILDPVLGIPLKRFEFIVKSGNGKLINGIHKSAVGQFLSDFGLYYPKINNSYTPCDSYSDYRGDLSQDQQRGLDSIINTVKNVFRIKNTEPLRLLEYIEYKIGETKKNCPSVPEPIQKTNDFILGRDFRMFEFMRVDGDKNPRLCISNNPEDRTNIETFLDELGRIGDGQFIADEIRHFLNGASIEEIIAFFEEEKLKSTQLLAAGAEQQSCR